MIVKNRMWLAVFLLSAGSALAYEIDCDNVPLGAGLYWNGSDGSGGITNQHVFFQNLYTAAWGSWSGFSFSQVNDTTTLHYTNQYAVFSGTDVSGTGVYAVVYDSAWDEADVVALPLPSLVLGFYVNNTTYAALAIRDGYYCKAFGGADGNDPDWFLLTVTGQDEEGNELGAVTHYLADYRFTNNALDYIQSDWQWLDLSSLGPNVKSLHFQLTSSDNGDWGMNTPAYFAMDNLQACYAETAGESNSTAFFRTTNAFVAWATGWTNYQVGGSVSNSFMTPENAIGLPGTAAADIVCLGNGGAITMTFDLPIADGPGPDFAVFENAEINTFLELAWVEVSSDGTNFVRFPNHSLTAASVPAFGEVYTTNVGGLAGKYEIEYGTPFDLRQLPADPNLDPMDVRWVRIVDIVGDGSCTDSFGDVIYDPCPTIGSGGFDLAGIGVINFRNECDIVSMNAGAVTVAWTAPTNRLYQLQSADRLTSANWVDVGSAIVGSNQEARVTETNETQGCRFYRVVRRPTEQDEE